MKRIVMCLCALLLAACSSIKPVPDGYEGPLAWVADAGQQEDSGKARIFALTEIDGRWIENSFIETRRASSGHGFALTLVVSIRRIPAQPGKYKLVASHATAAPIQAILSSAAGTYFSVEGTVDFNPKPGGRYQVKGELKKGASSIWIEDAETGERVTDKVVER